MGQLVDGQVDERRGRAPARREGDLFQAPRVFRNRITADGASGFPAESGRYHLYCAVACPWAHRAVLFRVLKELTPHITLWNTFPGGGRRGLVVRARRAQRAGSRPACALAARALYDRRPRLHDAGHGSHVMGCADAPGGQQRVVRDHPHAQLGARRHRRLDAGLLSGAPACRDRRDQRLWCCGASTTPSTAAATRSASRPMTSRSRCCSPRSTPWSNGSPAGAICAATCRPRRLAAVSEPGALRCRLLRRLQVQSAAARGLSTICRATCASSIRRPASPRPAISPA